MGRPRNTEQRRDEIVRALLRVMARRGYARASVASIAKEAGLSSGLLHYHFPNKQAVLLALIDHLEASARARCERFMTKATTPRQRLAAYLDGMLARGPDASPDAVACWVALGAEALHEPTVRAAYVAVIGRQLETLQQLVASILEREGSDPARAPRIAGGLLAAIEGAFRLASIAPGSIPEGSAASSVRDMAVGLLNPEQSS